MSQTQKLIDDSLEGDIGVPISTPDGAGASSEQEFNTLDEPVKDTIVGFL